MRRKLFSLKLKKGGSASEHIKYMAEIFGELSVMGDAVNEEDSVHLLASLPEPLNVLVTVLEGYNRRMFHYLRSLLKSVVVRGHTRTWL